MEMLADQVRAIRRKNLTRWCIRQVIAACIVIPIVWKWPHLIWLVYVWIAFALLVLVVLVVAFRKLERDLEQKLRALETVKTGRGYNEEDPINEV